MTIEHSGPSAELAERTISSLSLPEGSLIAAIRREGRTLVPRGGSTLRHGDRLMIIGEPTAIAELYATYA